MKKKVLAVLLGLVFSIITTFEIVDIFIKNSTLHSIADFIDCLYGVLGTVAFVVIIIALFIWDDIKIEKGN